MNHERLAILYKQAVQSRAADGRGGCSSPEQIRDAVEGRGPEEDRLRSLDHIMQCPHCTREFELLRSISQAQRSMDRAFPRSRWAIAAAITILVAAAVVWRLTSPSEPVFRGDTNTVTLLEPVGTVSAEQSRMYRWSAAGTDASYAFELLDPNGAQVYRATTSDTVLAIPDSVDLDPGVTYSWWVRVVVLGGRVPTPTLVEFTIHPD